MTSSEVTDMTTREEKIARQPAAKAERMTAEATGDDQAQKQAEQHRAIGAEFRAMLRGPRVDASQEDGDAQT